MLLSKINLQKMNWTGAALVCTMLCLAGCSKTAKTPSGPDIGGVHVDSMSLQQAFATAPPELQASASKVTMAVRYADYNNALAELDKLAAAPGLTDPQKKLVSDVSAQVKAVMAKDSAGAPK